MSMSDPIADMLTRIRNAQMAGKTDVTMPASKVKAAIAQVLKDEGYIEGFAVRERRQAAARDRPEVLRRPAGDRAIERVSQPGPAHLQGPRRHPEHDERPRCRDRSTSQGVMTDRKARASGVGGEVLCIVA